VHKKQNSITTEQLALDYRDAASSVRDYKFTYPAIQSNISSVEKFESCLLSFKQLVENFSLLSQNDADNLLYASIEDMIANERAGETVRRKKD
jgi:hypothetical protein